MISAGIVLSLGLWAFWIEPASIRVSRHSVELSKLPSQCEGLTIAILADLHVGSPHKGLEELVEIVELTNSLSPDLILLPGDFVIQGVVGGEFVSPEAMAAELTKLRAKLGVYAVLGNHDWWLDPVRVSAALTSAGIKMLEDKSALLNNADCQFRLVGISDYWEGPHDVEAAYAKAAENELIIAFTHNPDIFPELPSNTALLVAGHTHGGQVYIPLIGRPIVPSEFGERYAMGLVQEGGKSLFVSSGVGTSILPVRFLVPPEVTLIELHAPSS